MTAVTMSRGKAMAAGVVGGIAASSVLIILMRTTHVGSGFTDFVFSAAGKDLMVTAGALFASVVVPGAVVGVAIERWLRK